jgi:hypothetical protein
MTAREPETLGGLTVTSLRGEGKAWEIVHAASGKPVLRGGWLRQRRFAEQARADFLASGTDFTLSADELHRTGSLKAAYPAVLLWTRRAMGSDHGQLRGIDLVTGEHYSWSVHYGQVIPSAAHARELASALACYLWS